VSDQLALFRNPPVPAVPVSPEVAALAGRMPPALRLGTMSWTFPGWIGVLYAPGVKEKQLVSEGLTAYVQHPLLRTVEVDRSYYEPLLATLFAQYAAQVPDDFRFVVKAHEDVTVTRYPPHARYGAKAGTVNPRLLDVAYATAAVVQPAVEGLGAKLGPIVFQFSPFEVKSPKKFAEKLYEFLSRLPKGPDYAVELRNDELLTETYGRALADAGALHCHNIWGTMPSVLEQKDRLPPATRRVMLARWLGRPGDSYQAAKARYEPFSKLVDEDLPRRAELAALIRGALTTGTNVFVLANNKAEGSSPESLTRLAWALDI
jgi:uncharacterized protein YecE (DUF72 family)